jgi:hypothetical protein
MKMPDMGGAMDAAKAAAGKVGDAAAAAKEAALEKIPEDSMLGQMRTVSDTFVNEAKKMGVDMGATPKKRFMYGMYYLLYARRKARDAEPDLACKEHAGLADAPEATVTGLKDHLCFALCAYDPDEATLKGHLETKGFKLVTCNLKSEKDKPAHYMAVNDDTKTLVFGVCGTKSMACALTDGQCDPGPLCETDETQVHEGMARASRHLWDTHGITIKSMVDGGCKVVLAGHSLGAGTASIFSMLLKHQGIENTCWAYATPACVDLKVAPSLGHITSVVMRDDVVPRASMFNLRTLILKINHLPWGTLKDDPWFEETIRADTEAKGVGPLADLLIPLAKNTMEKIAAEDLPEPREPTYLEMVPPGNCVHLFNKDHSNPKDAPFAAVSVPNHHDVFNLESSRYMVTDHLGDNYEMALGLPPSGW